TSALRQAAPPSAIIFSAIAGVRRIVTDGATPASTGRSMPSASTATATRKGKMSNTAILPACGARLPRAHSALPSKWFTNALNGRDNIVSEFMADMQRHDPCSQIVIFDAAAAGLLHQLLQLFLAWMLANGFDKITVAVRVSGDQLAKQRQHPKRIS